MNSWSETLIYEHNEDIYQAKGVRLIDVLDVKSLSQVCIQVQGKNPAIFLLCLLSACVDSHMFSFIDK